MKPGFTLLVAMLILSARLAWAEDWTGAYAGFSFGYSDASGPGGSGGNTGNIGANIGYDLDLGSFVVGGEFEYDRLNLDLGATEGNLDAVSRLKLRGGYEFGSALGYVVVGAARANASGDNDTAAVYGIGVAYPIGERVIISGEALRQNFSNATRSRGDLDTNTFNLRTTFRF
ncbi:MAG: outer membrane protein [Ruegeria sp.]